MTKIYDEQRSPMHQKLTQLLEERKIDNDTFDVLTKRRSVIPLKLISVDNKGSTDSLRQFTVIVTSEQPDIIHFPDGTEIHRILSHDVGAYDLKRVSDPSLPAPLLLDHSWSVEDQVGAIVPNSVGAAVTDSGSRCLKATVAMSDKSENTELLADIEKGITRGISVGVRVNDVEVLEQDELIVIKITQWQILECSIVAIPADTNCKITEEISDNGVYKQTAVGYSADLESTRQLLNANTEDANMPGQATTTETEQTSNGANTADEIRQINAQIKEYPEAYHDVLKEAALEAAESATPFATFQKMVPGIIAKGHDRVVHEFEVAQSEQKTTDEGETKTNQSLQLLKEAAGDDVAETEAPVERKIAAIHLKSAAHNQYSPTTALLSFQEGGVGGLSGIEKDVHQMLLSQQIRPTSGVLLDRTDTAVKALAGFARMSGSEASRHALLRVLDYTPDILTRVQGATESAGLIHDSLVPTAYIEALRAVGGITTWGTMVLDNQVENLEIPKQTGVTSGAWIDPNSTADPGETNATFGTVPVDMHTFATRVVFTRKALKQSRPTVDMLTSMDLIRTFALALTNVGLKGTGTANQPKGIMSTTNVKEVEVASVTGTGNNAIINPTLAEVLELMGAMGDSNALEGEGGKRWIMKPSQAYKGRGVFIDEGSGQRLIQLATGLDGLGTPVVTKVLEGVPVETYSEMAANKIMLGCFSNLIIAFFGGSYEVREDSITNGGTVLRAYMDVGTAVRHPESFGVLTD